MSVLGSSLKERGDGVERALDIADGAVGIPLLELGDETVDRLVHNSGDSGVHVGEVVVEQRARAAGSLGHGRYR
mgnify:CR=1 FL=1